MPKLKLGLSCADLVAQQVQGLRPYFAERKIRQQFKSLMTMQERGREMKQRKKR